MYLLNYTAAPIEWSRMFIPCKMSKVFQEIVWLFVTEVTSHSHVKLWKWELKEPEESLQVYGYNIILDFPTTD